jgi:quercetin dioxygenase-like cupin family protein
MTEKQSMAKKREITVNNHFSFIFFLITVAFILFVFISTNTNAQPQIPGVKVKPILKTTLSGDDTKETIVSSAEFAPGVELPRHSHPGDDYTVVIQGAIELIVEGQEPRKISAGEGFHVPQEIIHRTRVVGDIPVRIIAFWVVEKGKPAMQPVPK